MYLIYKSGGVIFLSTSAINGVMLYDSLWMLPSLYLPLLAYQLFSPLARTLYTQLSYVCLGEGKGGRDHSTDFASPH